MAVWPLGRLIDPEVPRKRIIQEFKALELAVLMAGELWVGEIVIGFRVGFWTALAIYFVPSVIYYVLAVTNRDGREN